MRRYPRLGTVLDVFLAAVAIILCVTLPSRAGGQERKGEIEGKQPTKIVIVTGKDETLRYGKEDGPSVMIEVFGFDQDKRQAGSAAGPLQMTMEGVPVPVSFSPGGLFSASGSMSPIYANTLWEVKSFANLLFGLLHSTKGGRLAYISIVPGNVPVVYVSPDYIVFPEASRQVEKGGPFATVVFQLQSAESVAPRGDLQLTVSRNGRKIAASPIRKDNDFRLDLAGVKTSNDVLEWALQEAKTKLSRNGALGFPVRGARAGLVSYRVPIMPQDGKEK